MSGFEVDEDEEPFPGSRTLIWDVLDGQDVVLIAEHNRRTSFQFVYEIGVEPGYGEAKRIIENSGYSAGDLSRTGKNLLEEGGERSAVSIGSSLVFYSNGFPSNLLSSAFEEYTDYTADEIDDILKELQEAIVETSRQV